MIKPQNLLILLGLVFINNNDNLIAQNLVPNPSFEAYSICPSGSGQLYHATSWFQPRKNSTASVNQACSSEYFHTCGSGFVNAPNSSFGYQNAKTGNAYIGFSYYESIGLNYREYAEVKLIDPLVSGQRYKLEFYASLTDYCRYAIKQLDACFTTDSLFDSTVFVISSIVPQFQNTTFVSDTMNWTKVSGSFIAAGGERFLTLGNFQLDSLTDTLRVINNPNNYFNGAYYYIDDVSLMVDSSASVEEVDGRGSMMVYPNPAKTHFTINLSKPSTPANTFVLYSKFGIEKKQVKIHNSITHIGVEDIENGVYYWQYGGESGKIVVLK